MYWDRFDICEAYWAFYSDWHAGGLTERCYVTGRGIAEQLQRMEFRPAMALNFERLTANGKELYTALVVKYHETERT